MNEQPYTPSSIFDVFSRVSENYIAGKRFTKKRSTVGVEVPVQQGDYPASVDFLPWGSSRTAGAREFVGPEFNTNDIDIAIGVDGIVSRAINKYTQLIFKEGYFLDGKNQKLVDYIRQRFALYGVIVKDGGLDPLLRNIASDMVKYGNCIIAKGRWTPEKLPGFNRYMRQRAGIQRLHGVTDNYPISGYWWQEFGQMKAIVDRKGGMAVTYRQEVDGEIRKAWSARNIVHFTMDRPARSIWGRSFIVPVIDDIKLLRSMEKHAADLFYRYLNPLIHVAVGAKDEALNRMAMRKEVEFMKYVIENTPPQGLLVTDGRTLVQQITQGVEGLSGVDYLRYFSQRVMIGLGVSEVVLGVGNTTNRGTADSLVSQMRDNILTYQEIISTQFNDHIINELLDEIGVDFTNPDNQVKLKFREVDTDLQIKKDNNAMQKWMGNITTHSEARADMGLDPAEGVTDGLFKDVVDKDVIQLQGKISQEIAAKQAAVRNSVDNKNQPANQRGKKNSPKGKEMRDADRVLLDETQVEAAAISIEYLVKSVVAAADLAEITGKENIDVNLDIVYPLMFVRSNLENRGIACNDLSYCIKAVTEAVVQFLDGDIDKNGLRETVLDEMLAGEEDE